MISRKRLLLGSAVVIVGALAVGFAFGLGNVFDEQRKAETTIDITRLADGKCSAKTRDQRLQGYRWKSVTWNISDPDRCLTDAEVEIRFNKSGEEDSPFWFVNRPKHRSTIKAYVHGFARKSTPASPFYYAYTVWAVGGRGDYQMEDPELEIIQ